MHSPTCWRAASGQARRSSRRSARHRRRARISRPQPSVNLASSRCGAARLGASGVPRLRSARSRESGVSGAALVEPAGWPRRASPLDDRQLLGRARRDLRVGDSCFQAKSPRNGSRSRSVASPSSCDRPGCLETPRYEERPPPIKWPRRSLQSPRTTSRPMRRGHRACGVTGCCRWAAHRWSALGALHKLLVAPIQRLLPTERGSLLTILPHGPLFRLSLQPCAIPADSTSLSGMRFTTSLLASSWISRSSTRAPPWQAIDGIC